MIDWLITVGGNRLAVKQTTRRIHRNNSKLHSRRSQAKLTSGGNTIFRVPNDISNKKYYSPEFSCPLMPIKNRSIGQIQIFF
ncbi:protein of unknown function [Pararobbsia alpina]